MYWHDFDQAIFIFVFGDPKGWEILHLGNEDLAGHQGPTHL